MNRDLLPTTREGKLDRLIEECAEVIKAISKGRRFGWELHEYEGQTYDNIGELHEELQDLEDAIARVRCVDLTKIASER